MQGSTIDSYRSEAVANKNSGENLSEYRDQAQELMRATSRADIDPKTIMFASEPL